MSKEIPVLNEDIKAREVRLIGDEGVQYGIVSIDEALKIAKTEGLDLVLISDQSNPPVCKVMNYGKYKYQQEKKKKEAKKKQKIIEVKEIKLSVKIAQNDINFKVKHAREFLEEGKHVRFKVVLKGREMAAPEQAIEVLEKVVEMLSDIGVKEKEPINEGKQVTVTMVPKK
ncbi:MAG: translation initiation factor IF-3 [Campylobacterales bacterium]|nr:translation initiation factor IF-3 [Campylobacterales bacterium]